MTQVVARGLVPVRLPAAAPGNGSELMRVCLLWVSVALVSVCMGLDVYVIVVLKLFVLWQ